MYRSGIFLSIAVLVFHFIDCEEMPNTPNTPTIKTTTENNSW